MALERVNGSGSYMHPSDPGEPSTGKPRLSITDEEAAIIADFCFGERTVMEIGTGLGVSTRAIAEVAETVFTVDIDPWVQENIWPTLPGNVYGISEVYTHGRVIDVAFIDGDHSTEATARDIVAVLPILRPVTGVILLHDTNYPNVRAACTHDGWEFIETTHGIGVHRFLPR